MTTISATTEKADFDKLIEEVNINARPISIINSMGNDAVLISGDDWRSIEEIIHLNSAT